MQTNNFDSSSTGLNITVSAYYDTDLASIYFDESFIRIKEGRKSLLVYSQGQYSDFEKEYTFTKEELKRAWNEYNNVPAARAVYGFSDKMGFSYSKATKQDLIDFVKEDLYDHSVWLAFCEKSGFKSNYDTIISRGYSQGDIEEVIIPHNFWECVGVSKPDNVQAHLGDTIDHLLWDCPIYCRFTVNGDEFWIDECLADSYSWDKREALAIASMLLYKEDYTQEQKAAIIEFLNSALPEHLGCV